MNDICGINNMFAGTDRYDRQTFVGEEHFHGQVRPHSGQFALAHRLEHVGLQSPRPGNGLSCVDDSIADSFAKAPTLAFQVVTGRNGVRWFVEYSNLMPRVVLDLHDSLSYAVLTQKNFEGLVGENVAGGSPVGLHKILCGFSCFPEIRFDGCDPAADCSIGGSGEKFYRAPREPADHPLPGEVRKGSPGLAL